VGRRWTPASVATAGTRREITPDVGRNPNTHPPKRKGRTTMKNQNV